jgi:hypothetical protein
MAVVGDNPEMLSRAHVSTVSLSCLLSFAGCARESTPPPPAATPTIPAPPDVAAPPPEASRTASGLASKVLVQGTGTQHPRPNSSITVHYTGWTTDGRMFDSSVLTGKPLTIGLDEVIRGWTEGVQMMVTGEKRRFWIPAQLAYASDPSRPQGMLVFDIQLLQIGS